MEFVREIKELYDLYILQRKEFNFFDLDEIYVFSVKQYKFHIYTVIFYNFIIYLIISDFLNDRSNNILFIYNYLKLYEIIIIII